MKMKSQQSLYWLVLFSALNSVCLAKSVDEPKPNKQPTLNLQDKTELLRWYLKYGEASGEVFDPLSLNEIKQITVREPQQGKEVEKGKDDDN